MASDTDPFESFAAWYAEAVDREPRVPDAMQLATVGVDGRPSVRTVLMKGFGLDGLVFYTNLGSRKAQDLVAHPRASLVFHWKSLQRQAIWEGRVELVGDDCADAYFETRPRGSQLGAWASRQSQRREPGDLEARLASVTARFDGARVPRPANWGGFRLIPDRIELWQGRPDRLHERLLWLARDDGRWDHHRIEP